MYDLTLVYILKNPEVFRIFYSIVRLISDRSSLAFALLLGLCLISIPTGMCFFLKFFQENS
jgi:hypothetical protein